MDWTVDEFFKKHGVPLLTYGFQQWWIKFYGTPSDYDDISYEQDEYWVRCYFALLGWRASRDSLSVAIHKPKTWKDA